MDPLSDVQQHVLSYIIDHPGCRVRDIHEAEGTALGTIHSTVARLRDLGLVHPTLPNSHTDYGKLLPVETNCPAPAVAEFTVDWLPESASTTNGTGTAATAGMAASAEAVSPSISDATPSPPAPMESATASPSEVQVALLAAKELAEENAKLRDELAMSRDDFATLATAARLNMDSSAVHTMAIRLSLSPVLEKERNEAMDRVTGLNGQIRSIQLEHDRLQDALAEISALCLFLGFNGSGDVLDQVLWLLTTLGGGEAAHAFRRRQLLQAEAMELEAQSLNWRTAARDWMGKAQALRAVGPYPSVGE